ncbi:MAG TPA: ABC transporter substrate-binding protein [Dehalococcoidia bacterium]|nr:ABC transporter substrate-binding protein [Dehalococcoidia bacterium]
MRSLRRYLDRPPLVIAAGLALWATSCGGGGTPTAPPQTAAPTTESKSAPATQPTAKQETASQPAAGSGEPIKIGLVTGTSGVYAALGQDQVRGGELAAAEIGNLLGRPVQVVARDDKLNPQEAAKQAGELVANEKVTALSGCVSAATTLAVNEVAKRANLMYLGTCQTNQLNTQKDGGPYTFHFTYTPYQQNKLVDDWIFENLGKQWYIILADYAWGHENLESVKEYLRSKNVSLVGEAAAPLGTTDFSSFIPPVRAAKPEVLYMLNAGGDWIAFMKQAASFGVLQEMKLYHPAVDMVFDEQAGHESIEGTYGGTVFDWQMSETRPQAKEFVDAFAAKYGKPPSSYAALQYVAIKQWAEAVKRAGSLEPDKVSAALAGAEYETPWGRTHIRKCDRQVVMPIQINVGMSKQEAEALGGPFAKYRFRKPVTTIPASDESLQTCEQLGWTS